MGHENGSAPSGLHLSGADIYYSKRTRKPNSVYAVIPLGEALPLALISDLPGGSGNGSSRLAASGRCGARRGSFERAFLPIWSCSVWGLPCLPRYRGSGALLPHLFTLTRSCWAVSSLWHWPSTGLDARVPDVIRHTALRSSDFPPPVASLALGLRQRPPGPPASF
jgi:hypothetical protein